MVIGHDHQSNHPFFSLRFSWYFFPSRKLFIIIGVPIWVLHQYIFGHSHMHTYVTNFYFTLLTFAWGMSWTCKAEQKHLCRLFQYFQWWSSHHLSIIIIIVAFGVCVLLDWLCLAHMNRETHSNITILNKYTTYHGQQ